MEMSNEAFFYTFDELQVLAAVSGAKRLYGFVSASKGKKELLRAVYSLVRRGVLAGKETGYSFLSEADAGLISDMINASGIIKIYPKRESLPVKCCYVRDERLVCCEVYPLQKDTLKVYSIKTEELFDMLMDESYLPPVKDNVTGPPLPDAPLYDCGLLKTAEELLREIPAYMIADRLSADTGEVVARLMICDGMFGEICIVNKDQSLHQSYCTMDSVKKDLFRL